MKLDQFAGSLVIDGKECRFTFVPGTNSVPSSQLVVQGIAADRVQAALARLEDETIAPPMKTESKVEEKKDEKPSRSRRRTEPTPELPKVATSSPADPLSTELAGEEPPPSAPQPTTKGTPDAPVPAQFSPPPPVETGTLEAPRQVPAKASNGNGNGHRNFEDIAPHVDLSKLASAQNMRAVVQCFTNASYSDQDECVRILEELKAAGFGSPLLERLHDIRTRFVNQWSASVE